MRSINELTIKPVLAGLVQVHTHLSAHLTDFDPCSILVIDMTRLLSNQGR